MNQKDCYLNRLSQLADELIEKGHLEAFYILMDFFPEIIDVPELQEDEIVEFAPTEESFEKLKQRLIEDGLWRNN